MESKLNGSTRKIHGVETSRNYDANVCEEIRLKQVQLDSTLQDQKRTNSNISHELDAFK